MCNLLQEHFLENAKLSANYFITDCEELLVCCFSLSAWFTLLFLYSSSLYACSKLCRKLRLLLMSCPLGCMTNTFSASGNSFIHKKSDIRVKSYKYVRIPSLRIIYEIQLQYFCNTSPVDISSSYRLTVIHTITFFSNWRVHYKFEKVNFYKSLLISDAVQT